MLVALQYVDCNVNGYIITELAPLLLKIVNQVTSEKII